MIDTNANRAAHEIAQAGEISRLRSVLARIEGAAQFNAGAAVDKHERAAFASIAETAREALDGETIGVPDPGDRAAREG